MAAVKSRSGGGFRCPLAVGPGGYTLTGRPGMIKIGDRFVGTRILIMRPNPPPDAVLISVCGIQ